MEYIHEEDEMLQMDNNSTNLFVNDDETETITQETIMDDTTTVLHQDNIVEVETNDNPTGNDIEEVSSPKKYEEEDNNPEEIDKWIHKYNDFEISLSVDDPVENLLTNIFTEEIRYIQRVTKQLTNKGSFDEIITLLIAPLVPVIVEAVNVSAETQKEKINKDDAIHFIRCIIGLSIYRVTPTNFFGKEKIYPLSKDLNHDRFQKVLNGINQKRQSTNDDSPLLWDKPFTEDTTIRDGEEGMSKINRKFFIPNVSILSTDDDHLPMELNQDNQNTSDVNQNTSTNNNELFIDNYFANQTITTITKSPEEINNIIRRSKRMMARRMGIDDNDRSSDDNDNSDESLSSDESKSDETNTSSSSDSNTTTYIQKRRKRKSIYTQKGSRKCKRESRVPTTPKVSTKDSKQTTEKRSNKRKQYIPNKTTIDSAMKRLGKKQGDYRKGKTKKK